MRSRVLLIASLTSLLIVGAALSLVAFDNSHTFGPLTQSPAFRSRVTYIIAMQSPVVLTEASTGSYTAACHALRARLAAQVAGGPDNYALVFASHLVTNINVTSGGALTGTLSAGTLDTPASDAALLAAVASLWSTVSGCITNP